MKKSYEAIMQNTASGMGLTEETRIFKRVLHYSGNDKRLCFVRVNSKGMNE